VILLFVNCTLDGYEKYQLKFNNSDDITDLYGNNLLCNSYSIKALPYKYLKKDDQVLVDNIGTAFSFFTLLTLFVLICINLLQSTILGSFWAFINMIQIIFYVPLINCVLPANFEYFLTNYLSACRIVIPFNLLPSWIPRPQDFLTQFLTVPFNERFLDMGYASLSFIYNFADELMTWILLLFFYILLKIFCLIFDEQWYFQIVNKS